MESEEQVDAVEGAGEWEEARGEPSEVVTQADVESFLKVGTPATFQSADKLRGEQRYSTIIRGWYKDRYVLLDYPSAAGHGSAPRANSTCVVRFVAEGTVCGFSARLHDVYRAAELPFIRMDWPRDVQVVSVRRHDRVDVKLECEIRLGSGDVWHGTIRNLSTSGCSFLCENAPLVRDLIHLSFVTRSGVTVKDCAAIVRNRTAEDGLHSVGCEFRDKHADLESAVELLVASHSAGPGNGKSGKPRVLIIDLGTTDCQPLRDALLMNGCESYLTRSALEGLSCISELQPHAILVGHAEGKTGENDVCRMLKDTRGMEDTPVFVYNIRERELTQEGKRIGVLAYFNPDTPHEEISRFVGAAVSQDDS